MKGGVEETKQEKQQKISVNVGKTYNSLYDVVGLIRKLKLNYPLCQY